MNFGGNAALDLAAERAEQEREAKIAAASAALRGPGTNVCEDCPNDIPRERRLALSALPTMVPNGGRRSLSLF